VEPPTAPEPPVRVGGAMSLRLRRVRAAAWIDEPIAYRKYDVELGAYTGLKWCEPPAKTVERALADELFTRQAFASAEERVPQLDVELTEFVEVLAPKHEARISIVTSLEDENGRGLFREIVTETEPIAQDDPAWLARAMGDALGRVTRRTAETIAEHMAPSRGARPDAGSSSRARASRLPAELAEESAAEPAFGSPRRR
ncbi:MAG TPA: ABC-type transport auxiliary lipoprotein family protein, partial [Planctomycetota bacterium]|nr:ABC-type transport auxiliary lipoprotein family protein [Planctomycetota bacterium]